MGTRRFTCATCGVEALGTNRSIYCQDCAVLNDKAKRQQRGELTADRASLEQAAAVLAARGSHRAAIEHAIAALRRGRTREALEVLEAAQHGRSWIPRD